MALREGILGKQKKNYLGNLQAQRFGGTYSGNKIVEYYCRKIRESIVYESRTSACNAESYRKTVTDDELVNRSYGTA